MDMPRTLGTGETRMRAPVPRRTASLPSRPPSGSVVRPSHGRDWEIAFTDEQALVIGRRRGRFRPLLSAGPASATTLFSDGFESGDYSGWSQVATGGDGTAVV